MNDGDTGLLVVDKPRGLTSRSAVDHALRWFARETKIGHSGTLDPLATGVLVLCLGAATRLVDYIQRMSKTYRAGLLLGAQSDTDDADGKITPLPHAEAPDREAVAKALARFVGCIDQVPPAHSAAHVAGVRAYELARRGAKVALAARPVAIYDIDLVHYDWPHLELEVHCGKGTYIRSLARDLGELLGCGGLVASLRRTRVGPFAAGQAIAWEADAATAHASLLPIEMAVAELPRVQLAETDMRRLCQGQAVSTNAAVAAPEAAVFTADGRLAAIAAVQPEQMLLRPVKVFGFESRSGAGR